MPKDSLDHISESTPVRLSVVLACVALVVGAVWWASALQTKVDTILTTLQAITTSDREQGNKLADHETRLRLLEQKQPKP